MSDHVATLEAGIAALSRATLTGEALGIVMKQAVNEDWLRERAAGLGAQIRLEDGAALAVEIMEAYAWKHCIAAGQVVYV